MLHVRPVRRADDHKLERVAEACNRRTLALNEAARLHNARLSADILSAHGLEPPALPAHHQTLWIDNVMHKQEVVVAEIIITRELSPTKGRYVAHVEGTEGEAELTYARASDTLVVADHTFAPDSMKGMGVAKALVARLIADARADGFRIIPACSYVAGQYARHPEWSDVVDR